MAREGADPTGPDSGSVQDRSDLKSVEADDYRPQRCGPIAIHAAHTRMAFLRVYGGEQDYSVRLAAEG